MKEYSLSLDGKEINGMGSCAARFTNIFCNPLYPRGEGKNFMADVWARKYQEKKYKIFNKVKGGIKTMETKSRYEVIADLEEKKRTLILNRDNLPGKLQELQHELKDINRDVEDKEEEIKEFTEAMKDQKETINELIKSTDDSLKRLTELSIKK